MTAMSLKIMCFQGNIEHWLVVNKILGKFKQSAYQALVIS